MILDNLEESGSYRNEIEELIEGVNSRKEEIISNINVEKRKKSVGRPRNLNKENKVICCIRLEPRLKETIKKCGLTAYRIGLSDAIRFFAIKGLETYLEEMKHKKK